MASSVLVPADPVQDKPGWLARIGMIGLPAVAAVVLLLATLNFYQRWRWRSRRRSRRKSRRM
jgi:hypothetical protein